MGTGRMNPEYSFFFCSIPIFRSTQFASREKNEMAVSK